MMAGNREAYEQAMNAGHNAAWDQEWPLAIQSYGRAIQEFPEDPDAHIHLGLALLEGGRLEDALKVYTRAHQLAPDDPIPLEKSADVLERLGRLREAAQQYINVAEIYFGQRDFEKTLGNWERATRLTPGLVSIHGKLAQLRERIGDNKGAIREYLVLAFNFQRMAETDKAIKSAQRALRLDPKNPQVLNTIRALEAGHEISLPPDERENGARTEGPSLEHLRRPAQNVGEADPLGPMGEAMSEALGLLASYVIESGELDAAGGDALQAMELQRQGMRNEAIAAYQRAASKLRHPALKLNLGTLLLLNDQPDEAIKQLSEAVSQPQLEGGAYHGLGQSYVKLGQQRKAAQYLIRAVQAVDLSLAVNESEMDELTSIYDRLLTAIEGQSDEALTSVNRRFIGMLEGKEWKQRIADTRRRIEESMDDPNQKDTDLDRIIDDELSSTVSRIDRYIRQGVLTMAMDEAHRAVEVKPDYLPVHIRMAEIMMREGRVRNAIQKYNMVAKTYLVRDEHNRAASILGDVLEMAPLDISVRENLIELLEAQERWNEVIDQYIELADTYHQLGNFDQARDTFSLAERTAQRVSAPAEKLIRIKHRMADIDQMRLDMRRAQKNFEDIIQLAPDDERAHRMLVDIHYRQGNQIEGMRRLDQLLGLYARNKQINKITQLLEELVTLYGSDSGLRSRLSAIYVQLGRKKDAITQLDALGELQLEAGLHKEAANTIRKIISLNPDGVDEYRKLLAQLGG